MLYLNDESIRRCEISAQAVVAAVAAAFVDKYRGAATTSRQLYLQAGPALDFKAKGGVLLSAGFAVVKWYGFAAGNTALGLPNFMPLLLINSLPTGRPVALLNGHWISGVRTAGISVAAASVLADPKAQTAGFIAAGFQARSHFDALLAQFPLQRVSAYSLTGKGARDFVAYAKSRGVEAQAVVDPREAVADHQIVVCSTPRMSAHSGFLDARWLPEGAFVAMTDGGRSWAASGFDCFDLVVTDDVDPQTGEPLDSFVHRSQLDGELAQVLTESRFAELPRQARRAIMFAGSGLADAAVAVLVYQTALARGLGMPLPG